MHRTETMSDNEILGNLALLLIEANSISKIISRHFNILKLLVVECFISAWSGCTVCICTLSCSGSAHTGNVTTNIPVMFYHFCIKSLATNHP